MNRIDQITKRPSPFGREQRRDLPAVRVIPYDYVAVFPLTGEVGTLVQDVINISVEGVFVAVSIGYGLDEERAAALTLRGPATVTESPPSLGEMTREITLGEITLDNIPPDLLIEGFRINPQFAGLALKNGQLNEQLPFSVAQGPPPDDPGKQGIFQRLKRTENFGFLLSLVDTATGRELQNEPVHSVATLGRADGQRPFKMLPQPMVFMPRSTIRLQIEERTAGVTGRLFITIQGYKVLGVAGKLEERVRILSEFDPLKQIPVYDYETGNYRRLGEAIERDIPTTKIVPFDYVSTLDLTGKPENLVEDEIPINIDGGYVTTALGYSLDVPDTSVQIESLPVPTTSMPFDLGGIKLKDIKPVEALLDGIRIHPLRLRFAFTSGGRLSFVPQDIVGRMFQRVNQTEDVRFLYTITDSGTGRDLQNQPVYNVAGLGIADGDRPFKVLHKPMTFLPRSTIRVQVEEIFGRGRLFIVFQGYKILR
jgi:hypothetical protein